MKKLHLLILFFIAMILPTELVHAQEKFSIERADACLQLAVEQIKVLADRSADGMLPKTFDKGKNFDSESGWWTSGFYPGTLLYLYEYSGEQSLLRMAKQKLLLLEKEKYNTTTHDLGFMLYCSFGNAMRITGDTAAYREILLKGAESLATRYSPITKAIRSWDFDNFPVIIDNMMNLEFLNSASRLSGDKRFADISVMHANTTMRNHYRRDYSCYHVVDYDPKTGNVIKKKTNQGAFDESAWARGQAWGLYGYTMMYRDTGDRKYLAFAKKIASYMLKHPNMPKDLITYWDYDAPDLPADSKYGKYADYRDASTASLTASALLELSTMVKGKLSRYYRETAEQILYNLSTDRYTAKHGTNGGFLLKHSVGSIPHNSEVDVPLTYADYYYVEALMRYKDYYHALK
ncbi:glycoside hydrolase family 88 protein [Sphingobacterium griseoflavum]|uniref:Glucuronyl hydrolase n=1 Tax=Sphingobacterium griseoflavum TaxID=1474952 RepID=A0ABQ3HT71_9SPHI|nr:glycoside hydrolase family 88 protein [Sphingobacterium griseoflavum]GHE32171.1 glucuronyl hydrolase [Sphingobacterium griseoflavum]